MEGALLTLVYGRMACGYGRDKLRPISDSGYGWQGRSTPYDREAPKNPKVCERPRMMP
jgi:hypothetical protein